MNSPNKMTPLPVSEYQKKRSADKEARAQQIHACLIAVSAHFKVDPTEVIRGYGRKVQGITDARCLLWHHMRECGMRYDAIGRIWNLTSEHISKSVRTGFYGGDAEKALLAGLVRIGNETSPSTGATE